jgi:hypothetical protein
MSGAADAALRAMRDSGAGERMVPEITDWMTQNMEIKE